MSTDIFLGGLALLILAAIIIVALTTGNDRRYSGDSRSYDTRNLNPGSLKSETQGDRRT